MGKDRMNGRGNELLQFYHDQVSKWHKTNKQKCLRNMWPLDICVCWGQCHCGYMKCTIYNVLKQLEAFYLHRSCLAPPNNTGWQIALNCIECLILKLTYGIPTRLNSSMPMTDVCIPLQCEKLSPSQSPVYFPLPANVEQLKTKAYFPVAFWEALEKTRKTFFSIILKTSFPPKNKNKNKPKKPSIWS